MDLSLPLADAPVPAGFPSPAGDRPDRRLDLHEHLVRHPAATFLVFADGHSMTGAGIRSGDLLVVDRALDPRDGDVVIAVLDGDFTVKRLRFRQGRPRLVPEREGFPTLEIPDEAAFQIWGVVTSAVHRFR